MIERGQQRVAILGGSALLLAAIVAYVVNARALAEVPSFFLAQSANLLLIAGIGACLAAFHAKLARLSAEEAQDEQAQEGDSSIFGDELDVDSRSQHSLTQFQKGMLPVVLVILSVAEIALAIRTLRGLSASEQTFRGAELAPMLTVASLGVAFFLLLYFVGKYASGAAFGEGQSYLRPVAGVLALGAFVSAISGGVALLAYWGFTDWTSWWAQAASWIAIFLAVERVALWIIELYRPQSAGAESRPVYESRTLALFCQPRGPLASLGDIIEYQFGFQVSQASFGRVFRRMLLPFLVLQLASLWLLSCLVYVRPFEVAMVESWGSSDLKEVGPGLSVGLPWPMTRVSRVNIKRSSYLATAKAVEVEEDTAQLWSDEGGTSLLAGSQLASLNLASGDLSVVYRPADGFQFLANFANPEALLRELTNREFSRYLRERDLDLAISDTSDSLRQRIQGEADSLKLGIEILRVDIRRLQPPRETAGAFLDVVNAIEDRSRLVYEAERDAVQTEAEAEADANQIFQRAMIDTVRAEKLAEVEARNFNKQLEVYRAYPQIYKTREMMDLLEDWLVDVRKIVISQRNSRDVINLDLKEKPVDIMSTLEGN
ncbi:MAG: regulator of protease activity HflC (stomatin/prohibitin superfamily) [Rhodothermales bacterium]|jgi:regulator of protease activity HflC (stomatin/prohibitin superfamily)